MFHLSLFSQGAYHVWVAFLMRWSCPLSMLAAVHHASWVSETALHVD